MRIAAMAAGAVGGYFGARLAAAGHDVFFIARGANLEAMKKNGLKVESVHGNLHLPKPNVTDDPAKVGPVDIVLFAVKLWDTEEAADRAMTLVEPHTRVITLQNGVDSVERLVPFFGKESTVGGVTYIATVLSAPGVVSQTSQFAAMHIGHTDRHADPKLEAFVAAAKSANIDIAISENIEKERWEKFIFLTAMAGSTASLRAPIGQIRNDPDTRTLFRKLMEEAFAVSKASGISVNPNYVEERMDFMMNKTPPTMKASMAHDLERGNRLELDWLNGRVSALGKEMNVPTPVSDAIYLNLKLHRLGQPRA